MRRIIALLLTVSLCMSLPVCSRAFESAQAPQGTHVEATDAAGAAEHGMGALCGAAGETVTEPEAGGAMRRAAPLMLSGESVK